jgi:hypothetical protein
LQNIAIWDYWTNAEWADEIGVGGTRVQVMSLSHGWIWFIPLGPNSHQYRLHLSCGTLQADEKATGGDIFRSAQQRTPYQQVNR